MYKIEEKEIKIFVETLGYEYLESYVSDIRYTKRVVIRDDEGYNYDVIFQNLYGGGGIDFVNKGNRFALENISLWIRKNNKTFKLSDNNEYSNSKINLEFICLSCNEVFYLDWSHVYHRGYGCPYCSGHKVGKYNNLEYLIPELAKEWNQDRNALSATDVTCGSNKIVWWKCSVCSYEWPSTTNNRVSGCGCPACAGKVLTDKNSLSVLYPDVAAEWHPVKNNDLKASNFSYGSGKYAWWLCSNCGNEWKTKISHRTLSGSGCLKCLDSNGEKEISNVFLKFNFVENLDYDCQHYFSDCKNVRFLYFDFYLEKYNLCVEYHGKQHYEVSEFFGGEKEFKKRQINDKIKKKYCKNNNINLLIIPYWDFDNIEKILLDTLTKLQGGLN